MAMTSRLPPERAARRRKFLITLPEGEYTFLTRVARSNYISLFSYVRYSRTLSAPFSLLLHFVLLMI